MQAQWQVQVRTDEITDIRSATFALPALTLTKGAASIPIRPVLYVTCQRGAVSSLYVWVGDYVTTEAPVYLRFDGGTPLEANWNVSTDNTALFAKDASGMLDSLLVHQRLVFDSRLIASLTRLPRSAWAG